MAIISKETIISAFDDKMTLLQWLKKLEKVLDTSTLASIKTIKVANTQYKIVLEFEDGTKFESEIIQLQSEIAGIQLDNGHLIFTLMNGNTIDAGLIDVSNLGNTTIYGTFEVADGNATFGANVEVDGTLKVNSTLQVGDTTTNDDELAKLPRTLLTPLDTPTEQELVGIDTANGQNRITIGDNLEVSNGKIKVVNKFSQQEANYKKDIELAPTTDIVTENIYTRFEVINNVLHLIINVKISNTSNVTKDLTGVNTYYFYLEPEIGSKIFDFNGNTVNEAPADSCFIAMTHGFFTTDLTSASTLINPCNIVFINEPAANACTIKIRGYDAALRVFTLEPNQSIYITGRMALTLI